MYILIQMIALLVYLGILIKTLQYYSRHQQKPVSKEEDPKEVETNLALLPKPKRQWPEYQQQPNSPFFRLPLELREEIYAYLLPTEVALRLDHMRPINRHEERGIRLTPDGPEVIFTFCRRHDKYYYGCGDDGSECPFWFGRYLISHHIFKVSRQMKSEALAYLLQKNTLVMGHNQHRGGLAIYSELLGSPCNKYVRSVMIKEIMYGDAPQIDPIQRKDVESLTNAFPNVTAVALCISIFTEGFNPPASAGMKISLQSLLLCQWLQSFSLNWADVTISLRGTCYKFLSDLQRRRLEKDCREELVKTKARFDVTVP
jgi:hypothetical protein